MKNLTRLGVIVVFTLVGFAGAFGAQATTSDLTVHDLTTTGNVLLSGVTSNPASLQLTATNNSTVASPGSMYGILESNVFSPTGTPKFVFGEYLAPTINTYTGSSILSFAAVNTQPKLGSGFTGSLTNVFDYEGGDIANNSAFVVPQFFQSFMLGSNNGNGITTGTVINRDYSAGPSTASAGLGGTVSNAAYFADMPTGSGSGTTNNYGVYISGNGGTGGSGMTNNFAIYSRSAAKSYFAGSVSIAGSATTTIVYAEQLCLGSTCINETQLKALLAQINDK